MELVVDQQQQQPQYKYYCKICKKGFACGRALGGHMRAHGISDDGGAHIDDDENDHTSDWEAGDGGVPSPNKPMYALRTNPNRLKSCRACENCGKEFSSWKCFLEHGKCASNDAESLVFSQRSDGEDGVVRTRYGNNWSKRKRSLRANVGCILNSINSPTSEDENLAHCLMMLSNTTVESFTAEPEESWASASKEDERSHHFNFIAPNTCDRKVVANDKAKGLFECKACKKVFNSHQALGGHRASHKKVKGCFAAKQDHLDDKQADEDYEVITHEESLSTKSHSTLYFYHERSPSKRKSKAHECSICHRVFSSGQALGGHKRCHWITSNNPLDHDSSMVSRFRFKNQFHDQRGLTRNNMLESSEALDLTLDLNLAPVDAKPVNYQVSTEIFLLPWIKTGSKERDDAYVEKGSNEHDCKSKNKNVDEDPMKSMIDNDEQRKVKFAKLSEMKDMSTFKGSSPWLQVGIGGSSSNQVGGDP